MTHGKLSIFKFVQAFAFASLLSFSAVSHAQIFADDPCDAGYYQSLESRAWLEAQREITQNQNLIFKADSVLEYTCFDQFAGVMAHWGQPGGATQLFSGVDTWGAAVTDLPGSLNNVLGPSLKSYGDSNFGHTFLGGRLGPPLANPDYPLPDTITPSPNYVCASMNAVWTQAKCMNFIDNPTYDGFFTFAQYASGDDKRFLPTQCGTTADFAGNLEKAIPAAGDTSLWVRDNVISYFDLIFPKTGPECGGTDSLISTGVVISRTVGNPKKFNENVCMVPGCHYVPNTALGPGGISNTGTCVR